MKGWRALLFTLVVAITFMMCGYTIAWAKLSAQRQTISWLQERVKEKSAQLDACWGDTL